MGPILGRLDRFWFAEAPAARLAMLRILAGSYAAWLLRFRYEAILETTRLPASQFQPVGVVSILSEPPSPHVVHALLLIAVIACVPFILGLAYRVTGPLFAGLLLSVLTYYASWGSANHPDALLTAHVFILGFTRAADAISLDALILSRRDRSNRRTTPDEPEASWSWRYGFAVRLICAATAMSYFLAGIAKVSGPNGWGWGTGEVLLRQVAWDGLRKELLNQPPPAHAAFLYGHEWLFALFAAGSLVVELGAPLALLHPRLGYAWALAAFPMHWGIYLVMGVKFNYYLWGIAYASFFPLERALPPVQRLLEATIAPVVTAVARQRVARTAVPWRMTRGPVAAGVAALILAGAIAGAFMLASLGAPSRTSSGSSAMGAAARPTGTAGARPTAPTPTACPEPCATFQIVWVGDILVGDLAQRYVARYGYTWPFKHVRPLLAADFVVGNHEGPITARKDEAFPDRLWTYGALPASAKGLADAGFNAIGLSNNHVLDRGPDGLADTIRHLREAGIRPFGAGLGPEAAAPLLIDTPHGRVGVLAFGEAWQQGAIAGPDKPGTVPFSNEAIDQGARAARAAGARWVVAFVQWGVNYEATRPRQRQLAASFARAGYSLVVGHHPHVVQEVDIVQGMPVLYSIGNFVMGTEGRFTPEAPGYGLVARTAFGPRGLHTIELTCIVTDNDVVLFQPRPCDERQARSLVQTLGPRVTWHDGKALLVR